MESNTKLLIDYLETAIEDEMILTTYIRSMKVIDHNNENIWIKLSHSDGEKIINNGYKETLDKAIQNIYGKDLVPVFVEKEFSTTVGNFSGGGVEKKYTFQNYVLSKFNSEAVKMAKAVCNDPGKFSPLYISGGSGLGKTHLLHAIGNELSKFKKNGIYIEANKFTREVGKKSRTPNGLNLLIERYGKHEFILFDDIQMLGDRSKTLETFFEILNDFHAQRKQIIVASDKTSNQLSGFEERIITRFSAGLSTKIKKPDLEDLNKVLTQKLKESDIDSDAIESSAIKYITKTHSSSIRALEGSIKRISFFVDPSHHQKYTYSDIKNIFKEVVLETDEIDEDTIIKAVGRYYQISEKEIIGKSRTKEKVNARHIAMWIIRDLLAIPIVKIGKKFSNRDHSTVIASIQKIENLKEGNENVEKAIKDINEILKKT